VATISDEFMHDVPGKSKPYTLVMLRATPKLREPGMEAVWEHGRRNLSLRADGILAIVRPVRDGSGWSGVGIFNAPADEVVHVMEEDPGVQAGIFTYEVHPTRSFSGDCLPAAGLEDAKEYGARRDHRMLTRRRCLRPGSV
jgi:hypothetical protein